MKTTYSLQKYYASPFFYLVEAHELHVRALFLFPQELHVPCIQFFSNKTLHNQTTKRRSLTLTQTRRSSQLRSKSYSFIASFTKSGWTVILSRGRSNTTTTTCCFMLQETGKNSSSSVALVARVLLISDLAFTAQLSCVYWYYRGDWKN